MSRGIQLKQLTGANLRLLGLSESPAPSAADPPSHPRLEPSQDLEATPQNGRRPLDLRLVAREFCRELEITLGLLGGPAEATADPGEAPGQS